MYKNHQALKSAREDGKDLELQVVRTRELLEQESVSSGMSQQYSGLRLIRPQNTRKNLAQLSVASIISATRLLTWAVNSRDLCPGNWPN